MFLLISGGYDTYIFRNNTSYGADQEAYVTLSQVDADSPEQSLLLKSQSDDSLTDGLIEVLYDANADVVQVWTYDPSDGWIQHGTNISVTFNNGDQFGARAKANGDVEIYKNGSLLGTRNVSAWQYSAGGGYIGVWFAEATDALLDDFGGGTVTSTPTSTPTASATPTNTNTPTKTPTPSNTPTKTNTPAATNTPTRTPTPSATFTPTLTPTLTPTATFTPLPTPTQPPSFTSASFVYDGDGRQVKSIVNGVTTYFVGAHYNIENGVVVKYYFAGAQRVAVRRNGALSYLLSDHLGSTSLITNTSGAVTGGSLYKAWGETRYTIGSLPTTYKYTGQREESSFGLYFYNARWYDPVVGKFAQADTMIPGAGYSQAWDRYSYTFNNPLRYVDPSGHNPILILLLLSALLASCSNPPSITASVVNITNDQGKHISLGTKINSDTLLTHNHYNEYDYEFNEVYINGQPPDYANPVGDGVGSEQNPETTLMTFDSDIPGTSAQIASEDLIASLGVGDEVQVDYWDDENQQFATASLTIASVPDSNGYIILNDPVGIIDAGDSGGGAFYNNMLIGNTWWISIDPPGYVAIAVIPASITNSSKATRPVKADVEAK